MVKAKGRPNEYGRRFGTAGKTAILAPLVIGGIVLGVWRLMTHGVPWTVRETVCRLSDHLGGTAWRAGYTTSLVRVPGTSFDHDTSGVRVTRWRRCWVCGGES